MKIFLTLLLIFGQFVGLAGEAEAQIKRQLPTTGANIASDGFYISSIYDDRTGPDSIGTLLFSSNERSVTHKIALQSATFQGIARILTDSLSRDTSLRPISIRIKGCSIRETLSGSSRVDGEVDLVLVFGLEKESGTEHLTEYKSTARYTRPLANLSIVEPALRRVLGNSLKFIQSWISTEADRNPTLAKGIKLTFSDYLEQHDDTVYYNPLRPLIWDDFREKRSDSKFAASIFPSFGYDQRTKIENGIIVVELMVKVYVVKSASWVSAGALGNYNLNHEQKHFDLVKIIAERFKKKLLSEKLTPDNYQGIINFEYLEFYREMNKIQKEYDEQTSHGTSAPMQDFWNRKIDAELKQVNTR